MDKKLWGKKCNFWQFRGILTPGGKQEFLLIIHECQFFTLRAASLDISDKFNGRMLRYEGGTDERMNERTGPKTIVPLKLLGDQN